MDTPDRTHRALSLPDALLHVGDGWAPLLQRAFAALPPDRIVVQVKEKWGLLRIYADLSDVAARTPADEAFQALLWVVEQESATVCEVCGRPGHLVGTTWFRTRCAACAEL